MAGDDQLDCEDKLKLDDLANQLSKIEHFGEARKIKESEVISALEVLGKDAKLKNHATFHQYTYFLNKHGARGNFYLDLYGADPMLEGEKDLTDYYVELQEEFVKIYRERVLDDEKMDCCWEIARTDTGEVYYISVSEKGSGCIFALDRYGEIRFYAKNFIRFLEQIHDFFVYVIKGDGMHHYEKSAESTE